MRNPKYCIDASIRVGGTLHSANEQVDGHWYSNFRAAWRDAGDIKKTIGEGAVVRVIEYDPAERLDERYGVPPMAGLAQWTR